MDAAQITKPELPYRYEFELHELEDMRSCVDAHGFAVLKSVLPPDMVDQLQAAVLKAVDPDGALTTGQSRTHLSFVEAAPTAWKMLEYEPFMRVHRFLNNSEQLTVHRTAAIIRQPGSAPVAWHSDWRGFSNAAPKDASDILNRGPWLSGKWFYLTGSRPVHGGLCVIADSHVEGWAGPEGFTMTEDGGSFYPAGSKPRRYNDFDVPGIVPLFTDPGDMILFAHRTYHAAFPNRTEEVRLSCAMGFRPKSYKIEAPWPLPPSAQAFVEAIPKNLQPFVEEYTGIDPQWRADSA
jgi:hypothetical protein